MAEEFDEIAMELTPPDISNIAKEITLDLLPRKSRELYEKKYEEFMKWSVHLLNILNFTLSCRKNLICNSSVKCLYRFREITALHYASRGNFFLSSDKDILYALNT